MFSCRFYLFQINTSDMASYLTKYVWSPNYSTAQWTGLISTTSQNDLQSGISIKLIVSTLTEIGTGTTRVSVRFGLLRLTVNIWISLHFYTPRQNLVSSGSRWLNRSAWTKSNSAPHLLHIFCIPAKKSRKSNIQQMLYIFEIKATYHVAGQLV